MSCAGVAIQQASHGEKTLAVTDPFSSTALCHVIYHGTFCSDKISLLVACACYPCADKCTNVDFFFSRAFLNTGRVFRKRVWKKKMLHLRLDLVQWNRCLRTNNNIIHTRCGQIGSRNVSPGATPWEWLTFLFLCGVTVTGWTNLLFGID